MNKATAVVHLLRGMCLLFIFVGGISKSDISIGYQMSLAVPIEYIQGFIGKAFLMESDKNNQIPPPKYRTALSVEATENHDDYEGSRYSCSLDLFLGSVKVWSSGHRSKFYASEKCVLELTQHGDLRLKDYNDQIGWRTGTTGQGVQKLRLLETGNMVLVDSDESIKWQTFNFPTEVLLLGQRLSVATHLTSYPAANQSWFFYSLEIQHDKLGLYLNTGNREKYSYWEFEPSKGRNITFVQLTSKGLELFDDTLQKFAQIYTATGTVRFLALTGNLGLYYYNPLSDKFEPSFEALNNTCDLPLACSHNYTICTRTGACSCAVLSEDKQELQPRVSDDSDCGNALNVNSGMCVEAEMAELEGVVNVLRSATSVNVTKEECATLCLRDCACKATFYGREGQECEFYDVVNGIKEKTSTQSGTFLVKVSKSSKNSAKHGFKKWVLLLIVASDALLLLFIAGGLAYFFLRK